MRSFPVARAAAANLGSHPSASPARRIDAASGDVDNDETPSHDAALRREHVAAPSGAFRARSCVERRPCNVLTVV